jgi:signal transduction histidine kinase
LASISLQASAAAAVMDSDPSGARQAPGHIRAASNAALAELRATLGLLRDRDDGGLPLSLGPRQFDQLVRVVEAGGIKVSLVHDDFGDTLPATVSAAAYRILREALTNVVRHSSARHVDVKVLRRGDVLAVIVCDDGRGIAPGAGGSGFGITGMRERAASVGGSLEVGPGSDGGFLVEALLPLGGPTPDGDPSPPGGLNLPGGQK